MNAYFASNSTMAALVIMLLLAVLATGFAITRLTRTSIARLTAWLLVVSSFVAAERLTSQEPAGFRMLAIILALLWSLKAVVGVEEQAAGKPRLRAKNWWMFAAGWLGMRPAEFASAPCAALPGWKELIRRGAARLAWGTVLVALARLVWKATATGLAEPTRLCITAVLLFTGLSLILHFGLLNLLAGAWRSVGANCRSLFRAPLVSTSLTEFWSRRWNLAFSEMAAAIVLRPLRRSVGSRTALAAVFLFSGLLHEFAISVPVKAGFGLPLLYFALQALAVLVEKDLDRAGLAVNRIGWIGRLWTALWLLLPLPLLFHPAFVRGCLWPIIA